MTASSPSASGGPPAGVQFAAVAQSPETPFAHVNTAITASHAKIRANPRPYVFISYQNRIVHRVNFRTRPTINCYACNCVRLTRSETLPDDLASLTARPACRCRGRGRYLSVLPV